MAEVQAGEDYEGFKAKVLSESLQTDPITEKTNILKGEKHNGKWNCKKI